MTRARAPGKVVLSGAYAVLSGAPAIVTAVSRYVMADTSRPASFVTDEVRAALGPHEQPPWFDASELRENGRKLGLGSSAAILVASLFSLEQKRQTSAVTPQQLARVQERAFSAHRVAQGGGSGIDVMASTFGGTRSYQLTSSGIRSAPLQLPPGLRLEVWTCPTSASTRELLAAVARVAEQAPEVHALRLGAQAEASRAAMESVDKQDLAGFIQALRAQQRALSALGQAAGVPIVTPELGLLSPSAEAEGAALAPAGAGGGDLAIFAGVAPSTSALRAALENHGHRRLDVELGAPGVAVVL